MKSVKIIGAGLAGCEAALVLSGLGVKVRLYEAKPKVKSLAHENDGFAELVCSNSLKSTDLATASGLLKRELEMLDCKLLKIAGECSVPAGGALAVDRKIFSDCVTNEIISNKNIEVINELVEDFNSDEVTIIASGPLTLGGLNEKIVERFGENLHFFDASAPIVAAESIDFSCAFYGGRYGKGGEDDYVNCPLDKDEYIAFVEKLINAECAPLRDFENSAVFEGCMPVEVMAKRGIDTLRFGPLRPVGFVDPVTNKRPYAILQLRKENKQGTMFNLVGFQTNLKFFEQKAVFGMIPALKNAEFYRYGVMHRNSFVNAPKILTSSFACKNAHNIFIAGQLSGVEGYVESIASGHLAARNAYNLLYDKMPLILPKQTILGALCDYITTENVDFQPMNANFGLLPPIEGRFKSKDERKKQYSVRSILALSEILEQIR